MVKDLVACSDILVENFVPGMLDRFGLGYDDCAALNDRISASRAVMFRGGTRGAWFLELTSRTLAMICPPLGSLCLAVWVRRKRANEGGPGL